MNITIITSTLPYPLNSGGAQAQYNFIDQLRKVHHISIIFPENQKNQQQAMRHLQVQWPEVTFYRYPYLRQLTHGAFLKDKIVRAIKLRTCPQSERFQVERALKPYGYYFTKDFMAFVNKVIAEQHTDIIQVDFYPYQHIINYLPQNIKKIFVQHEIRYVRNHRLLAGLTLTAAEQKYAEQIRQTEINDLNRYDRIIALTQTDKDIMVCDGVTTPIDVSPAAVNTPVQPYQEWKGILTFVGGYSHIPNQEGIEWFIDKVLPLTDCSRINSINIVGGGWPQHYQNLHPKVHFLGFVDDLQTVMRGSIVIVPILTGSGMRMKILDAAAMGVPFITTSVGVEGLAFNSGESCLIANTPKDFANAINELISNPDKQRMIADNAQQIFKEHYSVSALSKIRNEIYLNTRP